MTRRAPVRCPQSVCSKVCDCGFMLSRKNASLIFSNRTARTSPAARASGSAQAVTSSPAPLHGGAPQETGGIDSHRRGGPEQPPPKGGKFCPGQRDGAQDFTPLSKDS